MFELTFVCCHKNSHHSPRNFL